MNLVTNNQLNFNELIIPCPIEEGHRMIPVKTVCTVIDVNFKDQDSWLKKHPYYSQLYRLNGVVAADNKERPMNCLPIFDVLSWLSSISDNKRREGSLEKQYAFMTWLRAQMMEMYKLIEVFQEENKYELELITAKSDLLEQMEEATQNVNDIKKKIKQIDTSIEEVRAKRFTGQTALPFPSDN